jgi:hypothetical protein
LENHLWTYGTKDGVTVAKEIELKDPGKHGSSDGKKLLLKPMIWQVTNNCNRFGTSYRKEGLKMSLLELILWIETWY